MEIVSVFAENCVAYDVSGRVAGLCTTAPLLIELLKTLGVST
jgi:hypothetical protein